MKMVSKSSIDVNERCEFYAECMSGRWKDAWRCPFVEKCWQLVQDGTNCLSAFVQNVSSMRESYLWLT